MSLKIEATSLHPYVTEAVDGGEGGSYLFKEEMEQEVSSLQPIYQINLLSGIRKQFVEDAERLFSEPMITWMESKGYSFEISSICYLELYCVTCSLCS